MPSKLNPVTIVLRGVDKVTGTVNKVSTRLRAMQKPVRDLSRAFSELSRQSGFSKVMERAQRVGTSLARLARNALFAGTAIGVAAVAGMRRFISSADSLDEAAQAAGISVERLQEVRFAAGRSGIGEGQIDQMMRKFSRSLGEVRRGTGALTGALKKSNPELLRQFRAVQSTDEGLDLLMRTLRAMPSQALRNVLAVAAVGKGGEKITLLADSYEELLQKARDLGIVLDRDTVDKAVKAQNALEDLGFVGKGLGMIIGSELLPVVLEITKNVTDWINENRELIRTKVPEFARSLAAEIKEIATWLGDVLPKVVSFVDKIGGLKTVLAAIAGVILGPVLWSIFALSAALLTTPFGWIVLGLASIVGLILEIVQNWDSLVARFKDSPFGMLSDLTSGGGFEGRGAASLNAQGAAGDLARRATRDFYGRVDLFLSGAPAEVRRLQADGGMDLYVATSMMGP